MSDITAPRARSIKELPAGDKEISELYEFHRLMEIEHERLKIKYGRRLFGKSDNVNYNWEGIDDE